MRENAMRIFVRASANLTRNLLRGAIGHHVSSCSALWTEFVLRDEVADLFERHLLVLELRTVERVGMSVFLLVPRLAPGTRHFDLFTVLLGLGISFTAIRFLAAAG